MPVRSARPPHPSSGSPGRERTHSRDVYALSERLNHMEILCTQDRNNTHHEDKCPHFWHHFKSLLNVWDVNG